jgi:hypothetical protein
MPIENENPKQAAKIPEICCPKCHLYQLYRGKAQTKCIHCGSRLIFSQLPPKLGVQKRDIM